MVVRTIRLFPSRVSVGVADHGARQVPCLRLVGGGDFAGVAIEVLLDRAALGQLEAELSALRDELRVSA